MDDSEINKAIFIIERERPRLGSIYLSFQKKNSIFTMNLNICVSKFVARIFFFWNGVVAHERVTDEYLICGFRLYFSIYIIHCAILYLKNDSDPITHFGQIPCCCCYHT